MARLLPGLHLVVTLGLALALFALGLPQTGDSALRLYADGEDGTAAEPATALLDAADRWFDDPEARISSGMREMWRAGEVPAAAQNSRRLSRALADLGSGLSRAPAEARGWTALAAARLMAGDSEGAVGALHVSLLVAPYDQAPALWRCRLGFYLWPRLDAGDRRLVLAQVGGAWDAQPEGVIDLARRSDYLLLLRLALIDDQARRQDFEATLRQR